MNILASLFFIIMALYLWPENLFDIPISQWTLKFLIKSIFSFGSIFWSINYFFKSLYNDRIWPWHWTKPYFLNLCIRTSVIITSVIFGHYLVKYENYKSEYIMLGLAIIILFSLFSSEFNIFEDQGSDKKDKT